MPHTTFGPRPQHDIKHLPEGVNANDLGVVGDGATDDTAAIDRILAANTIVRFPNTEHVYRGLPRFSNHVIQGLPTFNVPAGIYSYTDTATLNWADGLKIIGEAETLTFSSVGGITGSAGAWSVPITVSDAGGAAVGHFLVISAATGTGTPEVHEGGWEITGVSGAVITVKNTARNAAFPTHTLTGCTIRLLKTVFKTTGAKTVLHVYGGILSEVKDVVFQVSGASAADGTKAVSIAPRQSGTDANFSLAAAFFNTSCVFTGAGNHGFVVGGNASAEFQDNCAACANNQDGFHATEGGYIFAKFCLANGNLESGFMAEMRGDIECDGSVACSNTLQGFEARSGGQIGAAQSTTLAAYNLANGFFAIDAGAIRAASATAKFNALAGAKADSFSYVAFDNGISDNNTDGVFATKGSFISADDVTARTNSGVGILSERDSHINALGSLTLSGNGSDRDANYDGAIAEASNSFFRSSQGTPVDGTHEIQFSPTVAGRVQVGSVGQFVWGTKNGGAYTDWLELRNNGNFRPVAAQDELIDLGASLNQWKDLYLLNAPTVSSDERMKTNITPIDDAILDAWAEVNIVQFQWKNKGQIIHTGLIAQEIDRTFKKHGLDAKKFGIIVYNKEGDKWSIRAGECMFLEAAYQRRRLARIEEKLYA